MDFSTENEMIFCLNDTCQNGQMTASSGLIYTCMATVVILTVFGNLLVVISISHFKQLHTPTNFLILSLATNDMMIGVTVLPVYLISRSVCLLLDKMFCFFYLLCSFHFTFLSIYNVSLISLDRLYALSNPFQYSTKVTYKLVLTVICLNWLASFSYNLAFVYANATGINDVLCFGECDVGANALWASIDLFLVFILPCFIILVSYMNIFAIARKHTISIRLARQNHNTGNTKHGAGAFKTERKGAITLGIVVFVFVACLLPYFLSVLSIASIPDTLLLQVIDGTLPMLFLNSMINPIIYALLYPWFRKCIKLIFMLEIFKRDSCLVNVLASHG